MNWAANGVYCVAGSCRRDYDDTFVHLLPQKRMKSCQELELMLIKIKVVSKQSERFSLSRKFKISVLDFEKVQKCQLFFRFPPRMCNFEAFSGVSRSNIVRYAKCLKWQESAFVKGKL